MPNKIDLTNLQFGELTVLGDFGDRLAKSTRGSEILWTCMCSCGKDTKVLSYNLKSGNTKSCGHIHRNFASGNLRKIATTHGLSGTKEYRQLKRRERRGLIKNPTEFPITMKGTEDVLDYYGRKCVYCDGRYEELDHVQPLSKGGKHDILNLVPACSSCNRAKTNKILWKEWIPTITTPISTYINNYGNRG